MLKCYLGSLNSVKLDATKEVLDTYKVIGKDVDSGVSKQPLSDEETIQGAFIRAKALPKDGLRIGLEAGVQLHREGLFLVNWGVLIDQDENVYYAGGTRILLPDFIKEKLLNENVELADIMDEYLNTKGIKYGQGAIGYFTFSKVKRKDIFVEIVKLLYGQYLRRKNL